MKSELALVTGASGGIGREIALMLAGDDFKVYGVARRASWNSGPVLGLSADLSETPAMDSVVDFVNRQGRLDVLVHAAGVFYQGSDFTEVSHQHWINVQVPYYLTKKLTPLLAQAQGHVFFLNSLCALGTPREKIAQYAASKKALKTVADDLRTELNPLGVRVTSLFLGQVATEMQRKNYELEGWDYQPDSLMQPSDVASAVLDILHLPPRAEITDMTLRSTTVKAA